MAITHTHVSSEQDNKAISALTVALKTYIHIHLHIHTFIHSKLKTYKVELINRTLLYKIHENIAKKSNRLLRCVFKAGGEVSLAY